MPRKRPVIVNAGERFGERLAGFCQAEKLPSAMRKQIVWMLDAFLEGRKPKEAGEG